MRQILILVTAAFSLLTQGAERPNVLFIAIDDLNDYISPLDNHPGVKTPNFDRLAKRSVNFTNAHCAAPACHPSRVAVMTGVHPVQSGIYRNMFGAHGPRWRDESPVLKKAVVLSQHFRDHGYRAVGGGKIFTRCNGRRAIRRTIRMHGMRTVVIRSIPSPLIGQDRNWCPMKRRA